MYKPPFVYELLPLSFLHRSYDASAKVARARHFRDSPNEYGGGVCSFCIRLRIIVAGLAAEREIEETEAGGRGGCHHFAVLTS